MKRQKKTRPRPQAIMSLEWVAPSFAVVTGVSAFINIWLLPSHPNMAFLVGGLLGAMMYLRYLRVPKSGGMVLIGIWLAFCWIVSLVGMPDAFVRSL